MTLESINQPRPSAALLAIGDELLTGRTRDANAFFLGGWLEERGISLEEVRMVPDHTGRIVQAVTEMRQSVDFLFTCGGIGPTHDDITTDAIGAAFDLAVSERDDALEVLEKWYGAKGETVTDARRRMARIPHGARLIPNRVSGAPGFAIENVYVLAGVPAIFQAMLDVIAPDLPTGAVYHVVTVTGAAKESQLSEGLVALEQAIRGVKIGSYPGKTGTGGSLAIVCRSLNPALARKAAKAVQGLFLAIGAEPNVEAGFGSVRD